METEKALQAARDTHQSILVTLRTDGKPQLSNVLHTVDEDGVIRVSTTADRAKYKNLLRTPWAALHVNGPTFWGYAVLEGDVSPHRAGGGARRRDGRRAGRGLPRDQRRARRLGRLPGRDGARRSGSSSGSPRPARTARCARTLRLEVQPGGLAVALEPLGGDGVHVALAHQT